MAIYVELSAGRTDSILFGVSHDFEFTLDGKRCTNFGRHINEVKQNVEVRRAVQRRYFFSSQTKINGYTGTYSLAYGCGCSTVAVFARYVYVALYYVHNKNPWVLLQGGSYSFERIFNWVLISGEFLFRGGGGLNFEFVVMSKFGFCVALVKGFVWGCFFVLFSFFFLFICVFMCFGFGWGGGGGGGS